MDDDSAAATPSADATGPRTFTRQNLNGAQFRACDLNDVVMRAVDIAGTEIDAPWLLESGHSTLVVNGVDVVPYVEAELNKRFPGRELRRAETPDELHAAWQALERTWQATLGRVAAMPAGTVDISIDGEWTFAQTLRHLIMATDMWLGRGILRRDEPFHPVGQPDQSFSEDDTVFSGEPPSFDEVLRVRAEHVAEVRDFIAAASADDLAEARPNPHSSDFPETVLSCLRTIIEEEWEHHRFAVRDLDVIVARTVAVSSG